MTTPLRDDYDASRLRLEGRKTKDAGQARRLLALAAICDGSSRTEAAEIGGIHGLDRSHTFTCPSAEIQKELGWTPNPPRGESWFRSDGTPKAYDRATGRWN